MSELKGCAICLKSFTCKNYKAYGEKCGEMVELEVTCHPSIKNGYLHPTHFSVQIMEMASLAEWKMVMKSFMLTIYKNTPIEEIEKVCKSINTKTKMATTILGLHKKYCEK